MELLDVPSTHEFATAIRQRRRELRFTQDELAAYAGVGRRFVIELEDGKASVRFDKMLLVLKALGLRLQLHTP
jgi:HTH-type transcriptional regulator/antitoxin HipB